MVYIVSYILVHLVLHGSKKVLVDEWSIFDTNCTFKANPDRVKLSKLGSIYNVENKLFTCTIQGT